VTSDRTEKREGPLAGVKVLDFSTYIAAPYGCTLLADFGAEVIKIEPPQGDPVRQYPSTLEKESRAYVGLNRNKSNLVLDLKQPAALRIVDRLVERCDVLVHNFRPSVPERLGLGWERLSGLNPRLIYCAVTGYGERGPLKDRPGFDQVLQAMTGMSKCQGTAETGPTIVWGSVVDYYTSSMLAYSVAAALFERERSGRGQKVGVSLLQSALTMQSARLVWAEGEPREIDRDFRSLGTTSIYPTAKGWLYVTTTADHFWRAFCEITGLHELARDPRYGSTRERARHSEELVPIIAEVLKTRTAEEWETLFGDRVPSAVARGIEDVFEHPQVQAEGLVTRMAHPTLGSYLGVHSPASFSETPTRQPRAAPLWGEHTSGVLLELGFSDAEIRELVSSGTVSVAASQHQE
jgi:crotonobetainyl-CoA:carnitine CoA-transferase CaiB-like acyl-CoA transferase